MRAVWGQEVAIINQNPSQRDEAVEQAAEHAQASIAERRARQRTAAQAQAAEGEEKAKLEQQSEVHADAAGVEEERAQRTADAADDIATREG